MPLSQSSHDWRTVPGYMVEQAIAGRSVIDTWPANSHVLTTANGVTAESRAAMLSLTDSGTALTGAGSVICPALSKVYIVKNGTAQVITVKTAADVVDVDAVVDAGGRLEQPRRLFFNC